LHEMIKRGKATAFTISKQLGYLGNYEQ